MSIDACTEPAAATENHLVSELPTPGPCFEFFLPVDEWGAFEVASAIGTEVTFADGRTAICGISGLWNASLGYGNRAVADAIHEANLVASTLPVFRYGSTYAREAAQRLLDFARPHEFVSVFYSTSGSAAIDAVVKLSRQVARLRGGPRKRRVLSLIGSYHGITMGAMAVTGAYLYQDVYQVDERLSIKIPYDDAHALEAVLRRFGPEIACVLMEPVLGSGVLPVPDAVVDRVYRARDEHGFMVVADEVATGFYRTGPRFASHLWPRPDALVVSKALTNGTCAASAVLVAPDVVRDLRASGQTFWHGETQAGSPQSCAAIIATIDEMDRLDVGSRVQELERVLARLVGELADLSPRLTVSGRGAMWAIHIRDGRGDSLDTAEVMRLVRECRDAGALVQPGPAALQFLPALTFDQEQLVEYFRRVRRVVARYLNTAERTS
jgi:adenosylmethionine-8-amino-7-oxononanoate aminotransferase